MSEDERKRELLLLARAEVEGRGSALMADYTGDGTLGEWCRTAAVPTVQKLSVNHESSSA